MISNEELHEILDRHCCILLNRKGLDDFETKGYEKYFNDKILNATINERQFRAINHTNSAECYKQYAQRLRDALKEVKDTIHENKLNLIKQAAEL